MWIGVAGGAGAPRLAEMRLQALDARIDADLHLGRQAEVIGELRQLTVAHPLRERLHGLLMLALYRAGRQAEALAAYQEARAILVGELGTEPGPELRQLQQRILDRRPGAGSASQVAARVARSPGCPGAPGGRATAAAGARATHFTGRAAELAAADPAARGTPGRLGRRGDLGDRRHGRGRQDRACGALGASGRRPRSLTGSSTWTCAATTPASRCTPATRWPAFLRALGVAGPDIPAGNDERAARYRSLLAGRRMLVRARQRRVRASRSGRCCRAPRPALVVVTSRDALRRAGRQGRRQPARPGPAAARATRSACCGR